MRIWNLYVKLWVNRFLSMCGKRTIISQQLYISTPWQRQSLSMSKPLPQLCIKKTFLLRQNLFLCLGALSFCTYNCAFLLWNALPHSCSASNQNKFKVLFPLCFSQDLQLQNKLQSSLRNFLSLQLLLLEKLENKYTTWLFNFKTSPLKCLFLINHQIYTQKPFRGKEPPVH